jgi:hypothetical protein
MNLSSFNYFQEFQLNRKTLSVPDLDLPTETDQWVLATSAATLAVDWSLDLTTGELGTAATALQGFPGHATEANRTGAIL